MFRVINARKNSPRYTTLNKDDRGNYGKSVSELNVNSLRPIHDVPRSGVPDGHIDGIMKDIQKNGYDVTSPVSATRLPNGDLIITGGHHRLEAMKRLGESTVPVKVFDYSTTPPFQLAKFIGIGRTTGKYVSKYLPELTDIQKIEINNYLRLWRENNVEQVKNVFEF